MTTLRARCVFFPLVFHFFSQQQVNNAVMKKSESAVAWALNEAKLIDGFMKNEKALNENLLRQAKMAVESLKRTLGELKGVSFFLFFFFFCRARRTNFCSAFTVARGREKSSVLFAHSLDFCMYNYIYTRLTYTLFPDAGREQKGNCGHLQIASHQRRRRHKGEILFCNRVCGMWPTKSSSLCFSNTESVSPMAEGLPSNFGF